MIGPVVSFALRNPGVTGVALGLAARGLPDWVSPEWIGTLLAAMGRERPLMDAILAYDDPSSLTPIINPTTGLVEQIEMPLPIGPPVTVEAATGPFIERMGRAKRRRIERRAGLRPRGTRLSRVARGIRAVTKVAAPKAVTRLGPVPETAVRAALALGRARSKRRARREARKVDPASVPTPVSETLEPAPATAVTAAAPTTAIMPTPPPAPAPAAAPLPSISMPGVAAPYGYGTQPGWPSYASVPAGSPTPGPQELAAMFAWANAGQPSMRSTRFQKAYESWVRGEGIPKPHQGWASAKGNFERGYPLGAGAEMAFPQPYDPYGMGVGGFDPYAGGGMMAPQPFGTPFMGGAGYGGAPPFGGGYGMPSPYAEFGAYLGPEEIYGGEEFYEPLPAYQAVRRTPIISVVGNPEAASATQLLTELFSRPGAAAVANRFMEAAELFGPEAALEGVASEHPEVEPLIEALEEIGAEEEAYEESEWFDPDRFTRLRDADRGSACGLCHDRSRNFDGRLPEGRFYKSSMIEGRLSRDLGAGVHGDVRLGSFPFPIRVSANHTAARGAVSLAHELAHVADSLFKLGLSHDKVHTLGTFYATEGLPALKAYEAFIASRRGQPVYAQP